ncbi:hypothetical protein [Pandoraea sp. PE-S2R-1]|uniref:hypothetical protein n=1 Tax=Pandoraea sp. PE-S2R-1 TaxID=1986994 RepID=UPI0011307B4A|nr:hypothetical protein [Pandoraea sp. PE-S2R-1]
MVERGTKSNAALNLTDFRLVDYRIKSIKAESFAEPADDGSRGGTSHSRLESIGNVIPEKNDPGEYAAVQFTYSLDGFGKGSGDKKPHFSISVCAEFLFEAESSGWIEDEQLAGFMQYAALQAYPVFVPKVRSIAHEMGYVGVDPALGLRVSNLPQRVKRSPEKMAEKKPQSKRRVAPAKE